MEQRQKERRERERVDGGGLGGAPADLDDEVDDLVAAMELSMGNR